MEPRGNDDKSGAGWPAPGLQGDYQGSCVLCLTGTDSGIAFEGDPAFIIAGQMTVLGIPQDQAILMLGLATGCEPGMVPDQDDLQIVVRVCSTCAAKRGISVALIEGPLPGYSQH